MRGFIIVVRTPLSCNSSWGTVLQYAGLHVGPPLQREHAVKMKWRKTEWRQIWHESRLKHRRWQACIVHWSLLFPRATTFSWHFCSCNTEKIDDTIKFLFSSLGYIGCIHPERSTKPSLHCPTIHSLIWTFLLDKLCKAKTLPESSGCSSKCSFWQTERQHCSWIVPSCWKGIAVV